MKFAGCMPKLVVFLCSFMLSSCLLPGMIPVNQEPEGPMPVMEKDADKLLETLKGGEWIYLQQLAKEQYTEEDYARPNTLTYTIQITDDQPTYFNYGWCTTTEEILEQNFEHIKIGLYFNGEPLGSDVVHPITYELNDMVCLDFVALLSDWPNGEYQLTAVATFDEKINDGVADFEAGEYIYQYNVTVDQ